MKSTRLLHRVYWFIILEAVYGSLNINSGKYEVTHHNKTRPDRKKSSRYVETDF